MSPSSASLHQSRPTHTVEDYLMTMQVMERDQGEIVAARLAEMLNVAPATVAMTLRRIERDNWINVTGRKAIHITETGREAAYSVIRRHMLAEWLLVSVLKVPLSETHHEAHNIEHAISPKLEERMREILGNPQVCPHGNPFPGCEQAVANWIRLTDIPLGEEVTIRRIHELAEKNGPLLAYLEEKDILPGKQISVVEILPFNETISIEIQGQVVSLGYSSARYIFVERGSGK